MTLFQSTHPSGVRRIVKTIPVSVWDFNPRTPVGCDRPDNTSLRGGGVFQSTHPSGVRLHALALLLVRLFISIHAPQWGATSCPTRGRRAACDFNPRTPVGCDRPSSLPRLSQLRFQSTHPSGVRLARNVARLFRLIFQSTHPSGVRRWVSWLLATARLFQSTHPSGVRQGYG